MPPVPCSLFHAPLSSSLLRLWCLSKNRAWGWGVGVKVIIFQCRYCENTKTYWIFANARLYGSVHRKARDLCHSSHTSYWQREMLFIWALSLWTKDAGPMSQCRPLLQKASPEKKLLCISHSGISNFVRPPTYLMPLLNVLTLILISKGKVEYNYFCLGNFLRFPRTTTGTVQRGWAWNRGFAPVEGKCTNSSWVCTANQAELRTFHGPFPITTLSNEAGIDIPIFQIRGSGLKKSKNLAKVTRPSLVGQGGTCHSGSLRRACPCLLPHRTGLLVTVCLREPRLVNTLQDDQFRQPLL